VQFMHNVTPRAQRPRSLRPPTVDAVVVDDVVEREGAMRLQRLRWLSWLLDRSIPVGRWRIGLDPILGLLPGLGDWLGALCSAYIVYEGARLGMPKHVLARMTGNILVEAILGLVPFLGDVFDFVWQANTKNLALIERHYRPQLRPRSFRTIGWIAITLIIVFLVLTAAAIVLVFDALLRAFR
jgi:hypothetical protein